MSEYLKDSDVICAVCETLLNWVVKIRNLWFNRMIYHPSCRANPKMRLQPVHYGKIWDAFSMELQKEEEPNDWPRSPSVLSGTSPLLVPKRESYYDPVSEEILNEKFRNGGICALLCRWLGALTSCWFCVLDRPPSSCSADREVEAVFTRRPGRRKRRKRRNGKASRASTTTRPKSNHTVKSKESLFELWEITSQSSRSSTRLFLFE